jgi:hypothetical protein
MMDDPLPDPAIRRAVAEATRGAVVRHSGTDGYGYCYLYAWIGCTLARAATGRPYLLQAGTLRLMAGPDGPWLTMPAPEGGRLRDAFHCWFALPDFEGGHAEVVDLSSRHYRRWAESGPVGCWAWPDGPPEFVWSGRPFPGWMGLRAEASLTEGYLRDVAARREALAPVMAWALARLREEIGPGGPPG